MLAEASDDAPRLGVARTGLAMCYYNRGEVERGRALAAELLAAAEARGDRDQMLMGHANVAVPEHYQGRFASSLVHCERAIALYDSAQHHRLIRVLADDLGIGALNYLTWNLWFSASRTQHSRAPARRLRWRAGSITRSA